MELKNGIKMKNLHSYIFMELIQQDVKSLIKTLGITVILTKEIQYADAILALEYLE